jgi:hypothetical protein
MLKAMQAAARKRAAGGSLVTLIQPGTLESLDSGKDRCLGLFEEFAQAIQGPAQSGAGVSIT